MNIGVIIPELAKYGGAEKLLIECLRRWQHGHSITVYAMGFNERLLQEHGVTKIKKRALTPYIEDRHGMLLNSVLLPKIWEKEIGRHDIYHTHLWPMHLLNLHPMVWYPHEPLRAINDLKYEQPVSMMPFATKRNIHTYPKKDYDTVEMQYITAYQSVISIVDKTGHPDKILANSAYTAQYLSRVYGAKQVDVVYPGINREDFFYQAPDENIVLNVNQLWPYKRVNLIIEAMQYVPEGQLYIVGQGPEEASLRKQAKRLKLSDRVFFMGGVTNEELAVLYGRALCVAFVPVREPFGIVAVEAMASGKPLIAANEGGYVEACSDGKNAFLVNATPQDIAEKINYLIAHKDVATRMGLDGMKAVERFTWQNTSDGILRAMQEMHEKHEKHQTEAKGIVPPGRTLVGIDYFVWYGKDYGAEHWNDNAFFGAVSQRPLLGYYSSDSGEIIRKHLRMMEDAGIDYIVANVHIDEDGLSGYQYQVTERMMDIIEEDPWNIRLGVQLCPYTTTMEKYLDGAQYILDHLAQRKSYIQYRGKPLVFLFWTGSLDGDQESIEALKTVFQDCVLVASSMRLYHKADEERKTFGLFDGWSLFSPLEASFDPVERDRLIRQTYQQYEAGRKQIKVFTCAPGYNDTILKDRDRSTSRLHVIDRAHGDTFRRMLQMATDCDPKPDIIKLSTFNEFHENTHIEPTVEHGTLYMDILKEYTRAWRN